MKKKNKTICFNDPLGNPYLVLNLPEKEIGKIQNKLKGGKKMTVDEVPGYKDKKALEELYVKKGMSAGQIAKMFNVSRTVILYWLKRNGIEITTRKQPKPGAKQDYKDKAWLKKMLKEGKSVWAIAKDQGVAYEWGVYGNSNPTH